MTATWVRSGSAADEIGICLAGRASGLLDCLHTGCEGKRELKIFPGL